MSAENRLQELNLVLPPAPKPAGVYKPVVVVDRMVYVSGHGPLLPDGKMLSGPRGGRSGRDRRLCGGPANRTGDPGLAAGPFGES